MAGRSHFGHLHLAQHRTSLRCRPSHCAAHTASRKCRFSVLRCAARVPTVEKIRHVSSSAEMHSLQLQAETASSGQCASKPTGVPQARTAGAPLAAARLTKSAAAAMQTAIGTAAAESLAPSTCSRCGYFARTPPVFTHEKQTRVAQFHDAPTPSVQAHTATAATAAARAGGRQTRGGCGSSSGKQQQL